MNYKKYFPELISEFERIRPELSTEDKMSAALQVGCHYETVNRYLRGEVGKRDFAEKLLSTLQEIIYEKEE